MKTVTPQELLRTFDDLRYAKYGVDRCVEEAEALLEARAARKAAEDADNQDK